jgi:quercetin dioxygenase-like cupin family protein
MKSMFFPSWEQKVVYGGVRPQPEILGEDEKIKVIVAGLEPGQQIPPHPEALAVYHFLEGTGWMTVDDESYPVHSGATVITAQNAARGVEAETRLVFLAVRIE